MRPAPVTALVPVRITASAKQRLAHVLSATQRIELVRTLFDHVTSVLSDAGLHVFALSPEPIDDAPVEVWRDEGTGLNRVLAAALARLGSPVLVVPADLPLLGTRDVETVLDHHADVVIARARDGGTNGLLMRTSIDPCFGPESAAAHAEAARASSLRAAVLDIPGFALDVDDESSLSAAGSAVRYTRP